MKKLSALSALLMVAVLAGSVFAMQIIPAPPAATGDTDMDGDVDVDDLVLILQGAAGLTGDINGDGMTDVTDGVAMLDTIWDGGAGNINDFGDFSYPWCENINDCLGGCSDSDIGTIVTGTDTIGDVVGCPGTFVLELSEEEIMWLNNPSDKVKIEWVLDLPESVPPTSAWTKAGINARTTADASWFYETGDIFILPLPEGGFAGLDGKLACIPSEDLLENQLDCSLNVNGDDQDVPGSTGSLGDGVFVEVELDLETSTSTGAGVSNPLFMVQVGNGNSGVFTNIEIVIECVDNPADLNGDGMVDAEDLSILVQNIGIENPTPQDGDLDGDGDVDGVDLLVFIDEFNNCR